MNVLNLLFKVSILQEVVFGEIVERSRSFLENGKLRLVFVTFAADDLDALLNIACLLYTSTGNDLAANLKVIDVDQTEVSKDSNFYPLPWAANEILLNHSRNLAIWNSGQFSNALYRLPYICLLYTSRCV